MRPDKNKTYGLNPDTFRLPHRWAVDFDYEKKLSASEKQWLAKFSDEYYGSDFKENPIHTLDRHRRELHIAYRDRRYDVMSDPRKSIEPVVGSDDSILTALDQADYAWQARRESESTQEDVMIEMLEDEHEGQ